MSMTHEVIFETDGRHSSVYLYEPPMDARKYVEPIDEVLDLGIDTISYVVGDCSVLLYDTKVGERWGDNIDLIDHTVWYRAALNAGAMFEQGMDPMQIVCDHAHKRGFQFLPHLLLNMLHSSHERVTNGRVADFTTAHPEWQVGEEPDYPESLHDIPSRLSYAVPEVRANRLAVIRELVNRYPTDGIEVNFYTYAPFIARSEVNEHTQTITEWVRQIRTVCDEASATQGRSKRLAVRVGATIEKNKAMGMDVATWIRDELIDTIIAMPVGGGFDTDTLGLRELVTATKGTKVKVIAGQNSVGMDQTREVHYAAAANAYAAGAQGILYHRYYPHPHRYPYDDSDTGRIRFMAYPDVLEHMDKCHRISASFDRQDGRSLGLPEQVPQELKPGERGPELWIDVSDNLATKADRGELWCCEIRIMLDSMMHQDEVHLYWNGEQVPATAQRWADWIFQMRPRPDHVRGYRVHVDLKNSLLPNVGRNTLRVDLIKKNEKLINPITLSHVELVIEYLPHRHGLRPDEQYSGGTIFTP